MNEFTVVFGEIVDEGFFHEVQGGNALVLICVHHRVFELALLPALFREFQIRNI